MSEPTVVFLHFLSPTTEGKKGRVYSVFETPLSEKGGKREEGGLESK